MIRDFWEEVAFIMKTTLREKIRMHMRTALLVVMAAVCVLSGVNPAAAATGEVYAGFSGNIYAVGSYANRDGVSNVAQFSDEKGQYCCAYDNDKQVVADGKAYVYALRVNQ